MNWRDIVALVLAGGLSGALVIAVFGMVYRDRQLGEHGAEVLVAIGVAMVAVLSTYMARNHKNGD